MSDILTNLEHAEDLVINLLECAGNAVSELKEIQANNFDKNNDLIRYIANFFENLDEIKQILVSEVSNLNNPQQFPIKRPGIDKLAITEWEAKVIADNLHDIVG